MKDLKSPVAGANCSKALPLIAPSKARSPCSGSRPIAPCVAKRCVELRFLPSRHVLPANEVEVARPQICSAYARKPMGTSAQRVAHEPVLAVLEGKAMVTIRWP